MEKQRRARDKIWFAMDLEITAWISAISARQPAGIYENLNKERISNGPI